jgi:hypothetical protein
MFNNDTKRALWCSLLATLVGIGMIAWARTVEEQFGPFVFWAGLLAVLVGVVSAIGVMVAMLLKVDV